MTSMLLRRLRECDEHISFLFGVSIASLAMSLRYFSNDTDSRFVILLVILSCLILCLLLVIYFLHEKDSSNKHKKCDTFRNWQTV